MDYETTCAEILALFKVTGKEIPSEDSDMGRAVQILQEICDEHSHTIPTIEEGTEKDEAESEASEIFEALEEIEGNIGTDDFTLDFDGNEYRIISDSAIWNIYVEEIQQIVEDCYSDVLKLDKIPSWIAVEIDWEQTAKNAFVDGYGHTFSTYDGSEHEADRYWIFRTN